MLPLLQFEAIDLPRGGHSLALVAAAPDGAAASLISEAFIAKVGDSAIPAKVHAAQESRE